MAKTKEELNVITKELHALANKFQTLSDEELEQVTGGNLKDRIKSLSSEDLKEIGLESDALLHAIGIILSMQDQD